MSKANLAATAVQVVPATLEECIEILLQEFGLPDEAIGRSNDISDVATESTAKYTDAVTRNRHKQELIDFLRFLQRENTLRKQNTFVLPFCGVLIETKNKRTSKKEEKMVYMAPSPINVIKPSIKNVVITTQQNPLFQKLLKKKSGDIVYLNDQTYHIKKVLSPSEIELILIPMIIKD